MKILASLILIFTFALSYSQDNTWTKDDKLFMYQACRDITDKKYPTPEESETFTSPDVKQYIEIKTKACNCMVDQVQKTMLKATYKSWMENEQINFIESRVSDCIAMYKVALDALNVKSKQEDLNEKKETVAPVKEKQKISNKDFVGIWNCTLPNFLIKQNPKTGEREILIHGTQMNADSHDFKNQKSLIKTEDSWMERFHPVREGVRLEECRGLSRES